MDADSQSAVLTFLSLMSFDSPVTGFANTVMITVTQNITHTKILVILDSPIRSTPYIQQPRVIISLYVIQVYRDCQFCQPVYYDQTR